MVVVCQFTTISYGVVVVVKILVALNTSEILQNSSITYNGLCYKRQYIPSCSRLCTVIHNQVLSLKLNSVANFG